MPDNKKPRGAHQKQVVQSLLQSQAASGDEDMSFQPQATAAAYASQSSGILDTIADMQEKAEESLSSARKDEMESQHAYARLFALEPLSGVCICRFEVIEHDAFGAVSIRSNTNASMVSSWRAR